MLRLGARRFYSWPIAGNCWLVRILVLHSERSRLSLNKPPVGTEETSLGLLLRLPLQSSQTEIRGLHPRSQTDNEALRGCRLSLGRTAAAEGHVCKIRRNQSSKRYR